MMQVGLDYLVNALWQAPMIAGVVWLATRVIAPSAKGRHRLWMAALALCVIAPLCRLDGRLPPLPSPALNIVASRPAALSIRLGLGQDVAAILVFAALGFASWGALRLVIGAVGTRRLVRRSSAIEIGGPLRHALERFAAGTGIDTPEVRLSTDLRGPAIVGWRRPVVLVPAAFCGLTYDQALAVLLHETAHAARRDYLLNLVGEAISLPVCWHPVIRLIRTRVHAAREVACDELAAAAMPGRYAQRLIELARIFARSGPAPSPYALSLLRRGELEMRISALVRLDASGSKANSEVKAAASAGVFASMTCLSLILHVAPVPLLAGAVKSSVADPARNAAEARVAVTSSPTQGVSSPEPKKKIAARLNRSRADGMRAGAMQAAALGHGGQLPVSSGLEILSLRELITITVGPGDAYTLRHLVYDADGPHKVELLTLVHPLTPLEQVSVIQS